MMQMIHSKTFCIEGIPLDDDGVDTLVLPFVEKMKGFGKIVAEYDICPESQIMTSRLKITFKTLWAAEYFCATFGNFVSAHFHDQQKPIITPEALVPRVVFSCYMRFESKKSFTGPDKLRCVEKLAREHGRLHPVKLTRFNLDSDGISRSVFLNFASYADVMSLYDAATQKRLTLDGDLLMVQLQKNALFIKDLVTVLEREGIRRLTLTDANNFKTTLSSMDCNVSHWLLESAIPHFVYDKEFDDFLFCSGREADRVPVVPILVKSFVQVARAAQGGIDSIRTPLAREGVSGNSTMSAYLKGIAKCNKYTKGKKVCHKEPTATNRQVSCPREGAGFQADADFQKASLWDYNNAEMVAFFAKYSLPTSGLVLSNLCGADMKQLIYTTDNFLQMFLMPPPVGLGFEHCLVYTVRFRNAVMKEFGIELPHVTLDALDALQK